MRAEGRALSIPPRLRGLPQSEMEANNALKLLFRAAQSARLARRGGSTVCWRARSGGHGFNVPNPPCPDPPRGWLCSETPQPSPCSHSPGGEREPKSEHGSKGAQGSYRLHPMDVPPPQGWPLSCFPLGRWRCLLRATHLHVPRATVSQQERPGDTRSCPERGAHPGETPLGPPLPAVLPSLPPSSAGTAPGTVAPQPSPVPIVSPPQEPCRAQVTFGHIPITECCQLLPRQGRSRLSSAAVCFAASLAPIEAFQLQPLQGV